jgi:hypothetical protein
MQVVVTNASDRLLAVRGLVSCIGAVDDLCDVLLLAVGLLMIFQGCVVASVPH